LLLVPRRVSQAYAPVGGAGMLFDCIASVWFKHSRNRV
jgi:hypothetical protein